MKKIINILVVTCLSFSFVTFASDGDKYNHFPALKSPTTKTALCNLANYNKVLVKITQKEEMSVEDMVKIHELTYTLENALSKLSEDLGKAAVDLEEVHLASEKLDKATIKKHADIYANIATAFYAKKTCDTQKQG